VESKLARLGDLEDLSMTIVAKEDRSILKQLARLRARGEDGEYMRVPVSPDSWLIVSNAFIGYDYSAGDLRSALFDARPEWGSITTSKGWRAEKPEPQQESDFVDDGICTNSIQWIEQVATDEFGAPSIREHSLTWDLNPSQDEQFLKLVGLKTDAEYWAELRAHASSNDLLDKWWLRTYGELPSVI
jgi:hypothetical protein